LAYANATAAEYTRFSDTANLKGKGNVFLHGDLICTYILSEYICDIYVDGLCIISVKLKSPCNKRFPGLAGQSCIYFTLF